MMAACQRPDGGYTWPYPSEDWMVNGLYLSAMRGTRAGIKAFADGDGTTLPLTRWGYEQWAIFDTLPRDERVKLTTGEWERLQAESGGWSESDVALFERLVALHELQE